MELVPGPDRTGRWGNRGSPPPAPCLFGGPWGLSHFWAILGSKNRFFQNISKLMGKARKGPGTEFEAPGTL